MTTTPELSIIIPVTKELPPGTLESNHDAYVQALSKTGKALQFLYIVDGPLPQALVSLKTLRRTETRAGRDVEILHTSQAFGEAMALMVGFKHAHGRLFLTLPARIEVQPAELRKMVAKIDEEDMAGVDILIARRTSDQEVEPVGKFEHLVRFLLQSRFDDLRCGVRLIRAEAARDLTLYGNQHNFFPLIAEAQGHVAEEIRLKAPGAGKRALAPELSLILDILTVFFLIRFTRKPFRFFGGIGLGVLGIGSLITAYLVFVRLFFGIALADRPALILSTLMIVAGIQIMSVGLIGEIITFTYARSQKDYKVQKIVE